MVLPGDDDTDDVQDPFGEVVPLAITDELDLHTFNAREVKDLIPDYLDECVKKGISEIRIVHGKGTGVLRRMVHAALDRHPRVVSYRPGGRFEGGWGATLVTLRLSDP